MLEQKWYMQKAIHLGMTVGMVCVVCQTNVVCNVIEH
jgi:hypothetical protein